MKYIVILIVFILSGCTSTHIKNNSTPDKSELEILRSHFFNQTNGKKELAETRHKKLPSLNQKFYSHDFFQCSDEHKGPGELGKRTLSFEFEEMELRDAIIEIGIMSEISILMDDSVEGIVAGSFENTAIENILKTLLSVGEYDFRVFRNHIFIGSTETSSSSYHQLSTTCIYRPNYLDAFSLVSLLPDFYQRFIKINKQKGFIAITATNSMMHRIQHDITLFDLPQKQVVMELSIVEVSKEALEILGLDWQSIKNKAGSLYDQNLSASSYSGRTVSLPSIEARHFLSAVNALKNSGKADIKTMPSIVVLEGKEAKFRSMQTTWTPDVMASSHKKEALSYGVEMNIIPFVSSLDRVQLDIKNATVSDFTTDAYGLPKIIQHSITSTVSINNGESLIIGGLLQKKHRMQDSGIPMLQDIPFLGRMFENKLDIKTESEVLIIIQPRILRS